MIGAQSKKTNPKPYKNPLEALRDLGTDTAKKTANVFGDMAGGMIDQLFGTNSENNDEEKLTQEQINQFKKEAKKVSQEKKGVVFNYTEYYETTLIKRQIKELTEAIKREIEALKKADKSLIAEVKDIEKLTINDLPEKPGVYHVRFLEIVLSILRTLRAKVSESKTWLEAMITRKKKRGSLFAIRSKKAGTQYSLSQELQNARSVQ